ncbi:unnamed protein product [Polarella glacialis]|uniref:J domain-containing protein n=1 Tax=Polarella glacialis TaxID=89957 RepID=A0A813HAB7_POLGL|nr:unnamed protein product [Polarella glacialis]
MVRRLRWGRADAVKLHIFLSLCLVFAQVLSLSLQLFAWRPCFQLPRCRDVRPQLNVHKPSKVRSSGVPCRSSSERRAPREEEESEELGSPTLSDWAVLRLAPGASREEVRAQFKRLTATEHPDKRPGDTAATSRFQRILLAYQQLTAEVEEPPPAREAEANEESTDGPSPLNLALGALLKQIGLNGGEARNRFDIFLACTAAIVIFLLGYFAIFDDPERFLVYLFPPSEDIDTDAAEMRRLDMEFGRAGLP